jgi:hypothetical protein
MLDSLILDSKLFELGRRVRSGIRLIRREWRDRGLTPARTEDRLRRLAHGFSSKSTALYGVDGVPNPRTYVSDWRDGWKSKRPVRRLATMFDDKLLFYYVMPAFTPHAAPVLGIARAGRFSPVDEASNDRPFEVFLGQLDRPVVVKPSIGSQGDGVIFADPGKEGPSLRTVGSPPRLDALLRRIRQREHIVAPRLEQATYAREIFSGSANTIRVLTMLDVDTGRPFIPIAVHRFGTDRTAPIDAFSKGGLVTEVDLRSGKLGPLITLRGGQRTLLDAHPDTGVRVSGRQVPHWEAVHDHLLELAGRFPLLPYCGWDVIVTDESFFIIEGNVTPGLKSLQTCRPILPDQRVARVFKFYGVI